LTKIGTYGYGWATTDKILNYPGSLRVKISQKSVDGDYCFDSHCIQTYVSAQTKWYRIRIYRLIPSESFNKT